MNIAYKKLELVLERESPRSHLLFQGVTCSLSTFVSLKVMLFKFPLKLRFIRMLEVKILEFQSARFIVLLFVAVPPTSIELEGLKKYAYQGDEVVLTCIVRGAKPAATIKWQNNTNSVELPDETKFQGMVCKIASL